MFNTKNVKEVNIICFKEKTNKILNYLIKSKVFQFNRIKQDDNLIIQSIVNTEITERINNLLIKLNNFNNNFNNNLNNVNLNYDNLTLNEIEIKVNTINKNTNPKIINALINVLNIKLNINMLYSNLAEQGNVNMINGWIPKKNEKKIVKELLKIDKNIIIYVDEPLNNAPTLLNNNYFFKPFELLTKLYSAPKYGDIDPTPIFTLTFMIIFGIMSSDVADGLIVMIISLIGYLKTKKQYFKLGLLLGSSSVLFGLLFGEMLGGLIHIPIILFNPFDNPIKLLYLSLIIGIIHLNIGYIIGFINKLRRKGLMNALTKYFSFILIIDGGVLYFLNKTNNLGFILLILGLIFLILSKNINKIVELPSLIGNIISYSRILAINMAHLGINRAFSMLALNLHNWIIGIFIVLFGNFIVLTLGLIVAFVHSLRLHFVEFFTKFIKAGVWFNPYKVKDYKKGVNN